MRMTSISSSRYCMQFSRFFERGLSQSHLNRASSAEELIALYVPALNHGLVI